MFTKNHSSVFLRALSLLALGLITAIPAFAQTSTGTVRGYVKGSDGNPLPSVSVVAVETATNLQRGGLTSATGFFNLAGLRPGNYTVKVTSIGYHPSEQAVRVMIGQSINVNFNLVTEAIQLKALEVSANRVVETRTSEVATNISQEQIENIPLVDRNFLALSTLAPGVKREGGSITSGGQSMNNINVFIDGLTFKADILQGGVAGQDASKGNPFPQVAVQEFRVITQQYKAEYQKASSAIITATTKSGTNEWHGDLFLFGQNKDFINQNFITIRNCNDAVAANPNFVCAPKPKLDKWQGGGSLGGPIVRDKLFFFGAYEGNHQTRANTVILGTPAALPPEAIMSQLRTHEGTFESPFRSNLYFGKLTFAPTSAQRLEASVNIRDEYDIRSFGGVDSYDNAEHFNNDVRTYALRHQYAGSSWLNEASASWQSVQWKPIPLKEQEVGIRYQGVAKIGGRSTMQDFDQQRLSLRNDFSYTRTGWMGDHVFKMGANYDVVDYNIIRPLNGNPEFRFNASNNWAFPYEAAAGFGNPDLSESNNQFGVYIQDDWTPNERLALNLGIRWDWEGSMLNNDWVTPDSIRGFVQQYVTAQNFKCDGTDDAKMAQLCEAGRFMTDGNDRSPFLGALQPRFGFSYDLTGGNKTVLFGGFGVYYDRTRFNAALSEYSNLQWQNYTFRFSANGAPIGGNPTIKWDPSYMSREGLQRALANGAAARPELFLLENETKPPKSNQYTVGLRQTVGAYQFTANYTGVRGYNHFSWIRANRRANGTCCVQFPVASPPSAWKFTNVFVSTDNGRTWYDAIYLKAEKRYSRESKWGAQISYTLAWNEESVDPSGVFSTLDALTEDDLGRFTSRNDERHRVVGNWIIGLPLDIRFSGIVELATPQPYNATIGFGPGTNSCTFGNKDCLGGNDWPEDNERYWWRPSGESFLGIDGLGYRNVDLRLEKEFNTPRGRIGIIGEVFNVFDFANFTGFNLNWGNFQSNGTVQPNAAFGRQTGVIGSGAGGPRSYQLGLKYGF